MKIREWSEHGQTLIIFAVALVGLLGFTALALDGAMVYSDRRTAQNGADAASNAGAGAAGATLGYYKISREDWTCTDTSIPSFSSIMEARSNAVTASTDRANDNDYTDGANDTQVVVTTSCSNGSDNLDKYLDVEVDITTPTRPSLVQLVYKGPLVNTVTSTSRIRPGYKEGFLEGNAIVGLCPDCRDTVKIVGDPNTIIHAGSIFVNSTDDRAFFQNGTASIEIEEGSIDVVGGAEYDPDQVDADVNENQTFMHILYPDDIPTIDLPDECDPSNPTVVNDDTIEPGYWSGNKAFPPDGVIHLGNYGDDSTKIYCLDVTTPVAFKLNNDSELWGHNVFIYVLNGGVDWAATASVHLDAPDDPDSPYQGLLIYVDPHNYSGNLPNETVTINGKSDSQIEGTLFAPAANCKLNGTGDVNSYHLQALCYTIDLEGNGLLDVTYDPGENWKETYPPSLEVKE
jgi:hypothetical protein